MAQLTPDHLLGELDQVAQQVARGQVIRGTVTTRLRKGGVAFPASITYAPVRGSDDRVLAYSALVRDTSEQKDLQERLAHSRKHDGLGRLVPSLFHEAANRLTPVFLEARLIEEASQDPRQVEHAARLVKAVDGIQGLLRPLQILLNPPTPNRSPVQLNQLVEAAAAQVASQAQQLGVIVEQTLDPTLPISDLDPELMLQALTHLLQNSLQSLVLRPIKQVRIATRFSGGTLQVVVQDSGPLIPEARQAELFNVAAIATTEGLGLPIAETICRQHGGSLTVKSLEGNGNAFLIELPQVTAAPRPAPPGGLLQGKRALVVDDEPFLLECLVDALDGWGMAVASSTQGGEAIQQLEAGNFDLIVSDIRMPGLSGIELYDWLKAERPAMLRRILYTTGDSFDAKTRDFLETYQVPYLGKPFDLKQLKQSLELLLERPGEA